MSTPNQPTEGIDEMADFTLTLELGNDAMQTAEDVAEALRKAADRISDNCIDAEDLPTGLLHDVNGNTVGRWDVS